MYMYRIFALVTLSFEKLKIKVVKNFFEASITKVNF